ncbi:MAG: hypothetical protein ACLT8E_05550 [Akkermansia sp.]
MFPGLRRAAPPPVLHVPERAWGPPEDARAVEEWKRVQMELAEAVRSPEQPAEMEKVFEKENRLRMQAVRFMDMNMNNGKEGK